jgi:hypothetical protein
MSTLRQVAFVPREVPLEPVAAVGIGPVARALGERLLEWTDSEIAMLQGICAPQLLAVLGAAHTLPWVDGVAYLGRDERAPRLLLPTTLRPSPIATELVEQAMLDAHTPNASPLAVTAVPRMVLSMSGALPIRREILLAWIKAQR